MRRGVIATTTVCHNGAPPPLGLTWRSRVSLHTGYGRRGAVIGRQMDKQSAEIEQTVPGAQTERVGAGIYIRFESGILFP